MVRTIIKIRDDGALQGAQEDGMTDRQTERVFVGAFFYASKALATAEGNYAEVVDTLGDGPAVRAVKASLLAEVQRTKDVCKIFKDASKGLDTTHC